MPGKRLDVRRAPTVKSCLRDRAPPGLMRPFLALYMAAWARARKTYNQLAQRYGTPTLPVVADLYLDGNR